MLGPRYLYRYTDLLVRKPEERLVVPQRHRCGHSLLRRFDYDLQSEIVKTSRSARDTKIFERPAAR